MSIQNLYPNVKPSLLLDFANTKQLDPRITFTRASTGTYYDGKTVAKAEENLLVRSQELNNASWTKFNVTVSADSVAAPDGTLTADLVYPDTTGTNRGFYQSGTSPYLTTAVAKVFSIYAKASGMSHIYLMDATSGSQRTWFNVSTGAVGTTAANHTASIENVGNGWYRCIVTTSIAWSTSALVAWQVADADNSTTTTSSGTNGVVFWGAQLEQRSTVTAYTPTTTAPITNYIPVLMTAAAGVPRFEHNPVTGESLGLEIEEQRTNLLLRSQEFDNTAWTASAVNMATTQANALVAPDGTLTADKIIPNATSGAHRISQSVTVTAATHTYTVFAKSGEYTSLALQMYDNTGGATRATSSFNLLTGVATPTVGTASITAVGNGWFRCTVVSDVAHTAGATLCWVIPNTASSFAGNGTDGVYIWGAQLEAGAFATSFIPTYASQVTRAADSAAMTGTNFSSWYRADEGTLFAEASSVSPGSGNFITSIAQGGSSVNMIALTMTSGKPSALINTNAVSQTLTSISSITLQSDVAFKNSVAYATNNAFVAANGVGSALISTLIVPKVEQLNIGQNAVGGQYTNGTIKKLAYYPKRLTNTQLQAITI